MGSINLAYIVPKFSNVWYIDFIENVVKLKRTVPFERLVE